MGNTTPDTPTPAGLRTRRRFLAELAAGGGVVLGLSFGPSLRVLALGDDAKSAASIDLNAFIRIAPDDTVTIIAKHDEMGQGIHTGLAIAICEELEIDVDRVTVVPAPANVIYANSAYFVQVTGGSTSSWSSFDQQREAGAVVRTMLVAAAAARWGTEPKECRAENGTVVGPDGKRLTYGALAEDAKKIPVPTSVKLKDRAEFTRIGKPTGRVDTPAKVRGTAVFSLDRRMPNMLTAMVARSPSFGGRVKSFDAAGAKEVAGVVDVVQVPSGIAVLAEGFWAAEKGRDALEVEWDAGPGGSVDSTRMREDFRALAAKPGLRARDDGDTEKALADADRVLDAVYEVPYQAHAPMEPLNCLVKLTDDGGAEIETGSQMLGADHPAVAARLGVPIEKVKITNSYLGGGFGRRANPASDFVKEAVEVALAAKSHGRPVRTVWTRQDDLHGGWYRPMFVNAVRAGLKDGRVSAYRHRVVGQSIAKGTPFEPMMVQNGIDGLSVEGAADMPHGIPNLQVELHTVDLPIPVLWWRSVGHSNTAFAKESMIDECAVALGKDPYALRRELLEGHPRLLRVLDRVAKEAGWSEPPRKGLGRGISVHESFKGYAAHVVEAEVVDGTPRVRRVVCAIDCGLVVNPDQVVSQLQGAAIFALTATLHSQITFTDGVVDQTNFHDFTLLRMNEAPEVEVHIVESTEAMGGIGEPGVPGIASATCHALYEACGRRIRTLPVGDQLADV